MNGIDIINHVISFNMMLRLCFCTFSNAVNLGNALSRMVLTF